MCVEQLSTHPIPCSNSAILEEQKDKKCMLTVLQSLYHSELFICHSPGYVKYFSSYFTFISSVRGAVVPNFWKEYRWNQSALRTCVKIFPLCYTSDSHPQKFENIYGNTSEIHNSLSQSKAWEVTAVSQLFLVHKITFPQSETSVHTSTILLPCTLLQLAYSRSWN